MPKFLIIEAPSDSTVVNQRKPAILTVQFIELKKQEINDRTKPFLIEDIQPLSGDLVTAPATYGEIDIAANLAALLRENPNSYRTTEALSRLHPDRAAAARFAAKQGELVSIPYRVLPTGPRIIPLGLSQRLGKKFSTVDLPVEHIGFKDRNGKRYLVLKKG